MTLHTTQSMPDLFAALADPVRLAMVERLLDEGETSAGALAEPFSISKPAISRHISVLEKAGIIERRIDRQFRLLRVRPQAMRDLDSWMERYRRFWDSSFDRLEKLFPADPPKRNDSQTKEPKDDNDS